MIQKLVPLTTYGLIFQQIKIQSKWILIHLQKNTRSILIILEENNRTQKEVQCYSATFLHYSSPAQKIFEEIHNFGIPNNENLTIQDLDF